MSQIPSPVKGFVYVAKRFYEPSWGNAWKTHFSVDDHDGMPGHELKFDHDITILAPEIWARLSQGAVGELFQRRLLRTTDGSNRA